MSADAQPSEFSRTVSPDKIPPGGRTVSVEAKPDERRALVERMGILGLDSLSADVRLKRIGRDTVQASGHFDAVVRQECVVTGEELVTPLEGDFERRYSPAEEAEAAEAEVVIDVMAVEPPDPIGPGGIDVGELVAEELALALDPFPRKPGMAPVEEQYGPDRTEAEEEEDNPFAVLKKLKDGGGEEEN